MKKIISAIASITIFSVALVGCGTLNNTVDATGHAVGSTVAFVGTPVVDVVGGGVRLLTGQTASSHDTAVYKKRGLVHKNGHTYKIKHGKYVLVR